MAHRTFNNLFSPTFLVIHAALAFGTGILVARPELSSSAPLFIATLTIGLAGLATLRLTRKLGHFLLILFFLLIGISSGSNALSRPQASHHVANMVQKDHEVALIGFVAKAPEISGDRTTIMVTCQKIFIPQTDQFPAHPLQQNPPVFQKASGLVKFGMRGKPTTSYLPGDLIMTRARIGPPQGFNNPGTFNLPLFLASQDIFTSGWISSAHAIIKLNNAPPLSHRLRYGPERLRAKLINFLSQHLPERHSSLYRALICGDRTGLPLNQVELFRSLGIVHLLAISGLHMALLAGGVIAISSWLLQRSETILLHGSVGKIAACTAILPLILYCLVAGFQTPALRALLMILVFVSALLSDRQWHGPTNICLAALLILIVNPLAIHTVSFQLSFAAVTGIIIILPQIRPLFTDPDRQAPLSRWRRYILGSVLISLAASLATLPLVLYHFNRFTLSGPLATLVIEPFLCVWTLGWGLPASLLAPLWPDLALFFFKIGGVGIDLALYLALKLQPLAKSLWWPTPSPLQIALFYGGLFLLVNTKNVWLRGGAMLCCLILFVVMPQQLKDDQATILDVGQGNCTLIATSNGKVLVIDAGGPHSSFDLGRQVIAPSFWAKGIRAIDLLVISHPDQDHYSGATFLLEHFSPKDLWIPSKDALDPGWRKMLTMAHRQKTKIHIPKADETYPLGPDRELVCLTDLHMRPQEKQNNQSLVLKFTSASHTLLMPGDVEQEAEGFLVDSGAALTSDVIIAPHHGSASSSSREFLDKVAAQTVIFSASRFKQSLFPHESVLARYLACGAEPMQTAESGAITITFAPQGLQIAPTP